MSEIWGQIVLPGMFEEGVVRERHVSEAWELGGAFEGPQNSHCPCLFGRQRGPLVLGLVDHLSGEQSPSLQVSP